MAKIIAVANLKGGCGKSTIAVNLAGQLASQGLVITLIDADLQGTSGGWSGGNGDLPFTVDSMALEHPRDETRWIQRVLATAGDCVVLDCPPHLRSSTAAAVGLADLVLIPVFASGADLRATIRAIDLVKEAREQRQDGGPAVLLIPSRIDRRTSAGREIEGVLKPLGQPVGPAICQRAAFVDSLTVGKWVGDFAPGSAAHQEIEALSRVVKRKAKL